MPVVSIAKVLDSGDVEEAVRRAVALAGDLPQAVGPGATILVKPNVVHPSPSGSGHITDARVTEAVTKMVLERNPQRVVIGEGSSVGYDFPGLRDSLVCLEASGTADVARKLGVEMVDLNRDQRVDVRADNALVMPEFAIARTAYEADVILCLPVIKTHVRTGITCGMKNMKGVLPGQEKKRTHRLGLDRAIVDLNRVVRPHFTVVDAMVGMQGTHSHDEDRVHVGSIVAGADVVAVDAVCATIMGLPIEQIHHLKLAAEAGLGVCDLGEIDVRGEALGQVATRFITFQEAAKDRYGAATIIEQNACTGCMGELTSLFIYLTKAGYNERLADLAIILGTPDAVPPLRGKPVVIGQCAKAYQHLGVYVPGCPPHGFAITDGACAALGIDKETVHRAIAELHSF
jgi:uncharacterized protein (DUF362 family)